MRLHQTAHSQAPEAGERFTLWKTPRFPERHSLAGPSLWLLWLALTVQGGGLFMGAEARADQKSDQRGMTILPGNGIPGMVKPNAAPPLTMVVSSNTVLWIAPPPQGLPKPPWPSPTLTYAAPSNAFPAFVTTNPVPKFTPAFTPANGWKRGDTNDAARSKLDPATIKANDIEPDDLLGVMLLEDMEDTRQKLQGPEANPTVRKVWQDHLADLKVRLAGHREQVKEREAIFARLQANPRSVRTNPVSLNMDTVAQNLTEMRERYRLKLEDTNLAPVLRQTYTESMTMFDRQLTNYENTKELWGNLHAAALANNPAGMKTAKQELAKYLAGGGNGGKTPAEEPSLEAVMKNYHSPGGVFSGTLSRNLVRSLLFSLLILPPVIGLIITLRRRTGQR